MSAIQNLDAAWAAAASALPEGWAIHSLEDTSPRPFVGDEWTVVARSAPLVVASGPWPMLDEDLTELMRGPAGYVTLITEERRGFAAIYSARQVSAVGPTPAAALNALAKEVER